MTDLQDPLPENSFRWRRWFTWVSCMLHMAAMAWIILKIDEPEALKELGLWIIGLNAFFASLYMIAPSAVDLAKIVQASRLFRAQPDLAPHQSRAPTARYDPAGRYTPDDPEDFR